jgi:hypothetical protein
MRTAIAGCLLAALVLPTAAAAAPPGQTAPFPAVTLTPAATASPPVATVAAPPADRHVGYRLELAAVDLAGVAVIGAGVATRNGVLTGAGSLSLLFAAPIAHGVLGNPRSAGLSFAVRAGLPVLGILAGALVGSDAKGGDEEGVIGFALGGMVVGGVSALVIDYAFLARRRVAEPSGHTLAVTPTDGGAVLGVAGRF